MRLAGALGTIPGACGVGVIDQLVDLDSLVLDPWWQPSEFKPFSKLEGGYSYGGAGWFSSGFINKPICVEAYKVLKTNYKIVFQTPVRINKNSGNDFIFVLYDRKKGSKSMKKWLAECEEHNKEFNYPWK